MTDKLPENQPAINDALNLPEINQEVEEQIDIDEFIATEIFKPVEETVVATLTPVEDHIEIDTEYVRKNLKDIIEGGKVAMEEIMSLASTMESPRAYEVVAILMKATLDANRELMENVKEKKKDNKENPTHQTTNNNLFVGSTTDLQRMFSEMQKK
jgi:hypothetical protein